MFGRLLDKVRSLRQKAKGKAAYRAQLMAAVEDGVLTAEEIRELEQTREELGLAQDDVRSMRVTAYKRAFATASSDRRITSSEAAELERIRAHLGLAASEIGNTASDFQRLRLLGEIQEGNLPFTSVPGLILQKGEQPHWSERAQLIEPRVVRRRYEGGSSGVSFRIMKGVTYRVGAHRGHLIADTANLPISAGDFVITNKRVLFKGDRKSFNYRHDKLLGIELFSDGLSLADSAGKNRLLRFDIPANSELVGAVLTQVVNQVADA
jgi:hypothetical protein